MTETNLEPAGNPKRKWYHELWFVIAMLLAIGPFAFPLLWKSPALNTQVKWWITVLFSILTIFALWLSFETVKLTLKYVNEIRAVLS